MFKGRKERRMTDMIIEIILFIMLFGFGFSVIFVLTAIAIEMLRESAFSATFDAIDEKIAEMIRGKEE